MTMKTSGRFCKECGASISNRLYQFERVEAEEEAAILSTLHTLTGDATRERRDIEQLRAEVAQREQDLEAVEGRPEGETEPSRIEEPARVEVLP
jgi:hypothetical protein